MNSLVKKIMKLISWLRNRKDYKNGKKLNLKNILNYLGAEYNYWRSTSSFIDCPPHIQEQSIWRLNQVKQISPACFQGNKCINCGCDVIEESFGNSGCVYGCYPDLLNRQEWETFKKKNKIDIIC